MKCLALITAVLFVMVFLVPLIVAEIQLKYMRETNRHMRKLTEAHEPHGRIPLNLVYRVQTNPKNW